MSVRGTVTLECDTKGCHAEIVIEPGTGDCNRHDDWIAVEVFAKDWWMDDDDLVYCPDCHPDMDPREKNEDDGREYGHPGDRLAGRE